MPSVLHRTMWPSASACQTTSVTIQMQDVRQVSACVVSLWSMLSVNIFCHPLARPSTEPLEIGCASNEDCPDYAACQNTHCINPCAVRDPCAPLATCRVVNHAPVCTCPDGYIGSPEVECRPRELS